VSQSIREIKQPAAGPVLDQPNQSTTANILSIATPHLAQISQMVSFLKIFQLNLHIRLTAVVPATFLGRLIILSFINIIIFGKDYKLFIFSL
jgi:hypothetical protein